MGRKTLVINKAFPEHNPNSISYLHEKQLMTMNTERDFEVMMSRQLGADEILLYVMRPPKPSGSTGSVETSSHSDLGEVQESTKASQKVRLWHVSLDP